MPKNRIVSTFTSLFKIPVFINRSREQNKCLFCAQSSFTSEKKPSSELQLSARRHYSQSDEVRFLPYCLSILFIEIHN